MKRLCSVPVLLLSILLLLSSCQAPASSGSGTVPAASSGAPVAAPPAADPPAGEPDADPVPDPEPEPETPLYHLPADTDCDARLSHTGWHCLAETEDAYYAVQMYSHFVTVYDKATGEAYALCGRPECSHDDPLCDAYVNTSAEFLTVYRGRLYWLGHDPMYRYRRDVPYDLSVWSMDLDGTNRTKVKDLPEEVWRGAIYDMYVHRGYVFLEQKNQTVTDGAPGMELIVYQAPLDRDGPFTALVYRKTESGDNQIKPVGDWLYVLTWDRLTSERPFHYTYRLSRFRLTDGQEEALLTWEDTHFTAYSMYGLYVDRNENVYLCGYDNSVGETGGCGLVYRVTGGRAEKIMDFADPEVLFQIPMPTEDLIVAQTRTDDGKHLVWLRDMEGNTLYKGAWEPRYRRTGAGEELRFTLFFIGGERDYYLAFCLDMDTDGKYFLRFDVTPEGLTETVLWKERLGIWNP